VREYVRCAWQEGAIDTVTYPGVAGT